VLGEIEGVRLPGYHVHGGNGGGSARQVEEHARLLVVVVSEDRSLAHLPAEECPRLEAVQDLAQCPARVLSLEACGDDLVRHPEGQSRCRRRATKIRTTYWRPVRKNRKRLGADLEIPFCRSRNV